MNILLLDILLLVVSLGCLWYWLVHHESGVKRCWQALVQHRRVAAWRRRFAQQLEFLLDRLSPQGYLGLHLTLGVLVLVGASWMFGGIAEDVVAGDPMTIVDKKVSAWLHARQTTGLTTIMQLMTSLASTVWVAGITLLAALMLWQKRHWYQLLALLLAMPGGMALVFLLKAAFHRQRPVFADAYMMFDGYSFPSGHTMAATLLYGLLAAYAVLSFDAWRWRVGAILGAAAMVILVGFSRVYLGAHYPSDVLAAAVAGLAWLALCLTAVGILRRSSGRPV